MSDWLTRQAEEAAKRADERYGEGAYGGTAWMRQKTEEAAKSKASQPVRNSNTTSPNNGGGDWLTRQAQEAAKQTDQRYGAGAYGGTEWLSLDKWSGFRSWVDDINNFSTRMTNGFASRDGQYQSKDAMGRIRFDASQEANTLRSRADMYRNHFAENQAHYDSLYGAGTTEKILQNLSHNTNYLDSVLTDLTNEYNRWSQFENEDQYNEHVRLSNLDLDTARKELAELEAQLEEAEKARNNAYLRPDLLEGMGVGGDGSPFSIDMSNTHLTPEGIEDVQSQYNELNDRVNALRQDIYNAEYLQKGQNYAALTQSLDFETYAKQGAAMDSPIKDTEGDGLFYSIGETLGGKNPYSYLTDDEASIYNYLLAKEGEKSAQEYLDFMRETLNARSGAEIAGRVQGSDNWLDRFLAHGVYSVGGGLSQFASGIGQLFSEERLPTTPIQFANQELAEDLDGLGYYAFQAGTTVGNMLPAIAVTLATGGLGASAGVASTVGAATVGLSSGGNAYNQALAEGYTTEQARDYGIAVGASEAILERLLGGVGSKLGISEEMLLPKIRMIDKAWARIALTGTVKFGAEITEEELQLFLEPAYRTIIFGEDYELPEVQEILETAIITALSTGMLESGSIVSAGKTPQTDITAKPGNTEPLQMTAQDNATLTQRDEAAPEGEIPTQTENAPSADERATAAAYEAGRANVPRESITLETPAQEEAYNNGRIEYIKNTAQPTDTTQQSVETAPATEQRMPKGMEKAAINTAMVRDAAASLGENGAKALAHVYTPEIAAQYSPTKVAVAFAKLYNATLDGKEIDADLAKEVKGLPATIRMAAVDSAKNDAVIAKQAKYFGEDAKLVKDNNWKMANLSTKDTRKLDALAKVLGVQIRFAPKVADGAANAQYIRGTNGGIIELALDGNDPFMTSAVHEAIHRIREAAPEMYGELSEFVRHNMSRDAKYMAMGERALRYQTDNVSDITEEMVADAFGRMMNDSEVLSKFAGEHRTVVQRIMDAIRDMINAVKRALNGQNVELTENQKAEFRDLQDKLTEMEKVFRTALKESEVKTEQRKTTTTRDGVLTRTTDADGTTVLTTANDNPVAQMDEDGSALFSLKTYEAFGRAELKRWLDLRVSKNLLSKEDAADIVKQLDEYYDLCQQFKNKYAPFGAWSEASVVTDNKGKPVFSVVKANGEYAMNLDFSLVCKKRRTLDAVFGEMIKRDVMNFVTLEEADIVKINDIIRENGFETACALCFVDSKRYRQAKVTDSFVSQYNELVRMLLPEGGDVKAHHFDFVESGHYKNGGTGLHTVSNAELAEGINKLKQVMRENGSQTVAHKIAKHLLNHPSDRKLVDRSDFMNTDGFGAVKLKNPAVMKLYNSSKGSGGPKAAFSDVQYLGEILSKKGFAAQKAYLVGGVRIQSFSDYIPRLVFDYLQMVGDLAAKKLPAHAYTKEATFVKQFGMTGIKMNMSLVPDVSKSGIAPGLDKDGNYIWKDGQSFGSDVAIKGSGQTGFDLAIEIQNAEGYSKHCGTIAVGVSKEHITKMLGDENIRMIIPYHKSSLNHIVAMLNNIDQFTDYTGVQNTRGADGKKISGKEFNFNEALIRLGDAKLAANEYLAWCQEHNYIPKFDEFAYHENYYKLLEDFATYDNGVASPQGAVTMTFPKEGDAFGSMTELIEQGLDEDAVLEGRRDSKLSSIVDQVEAALNKKTDSAVDDLAEHGLTTANAVQDNKKYSLKDSEGNTLTKSQQDFFEKSKARDKDGNLQVFYHGTQSGGFTVFDPERSDDRTSLFFTSSLHNAASYSGTYDIHDPSTEANASAATNYGVYLNLTNPLIIYAQDSNFDEIRFFTDEMKAMSDRAKELINYGYSLDKDDPRREAALDESTEIEYALDDMDRWNGDIKDTRYAARWAKSHGYDGVIFYDLVDYADAVDVPIESATVAIAFRSDQVKSISNTKPSGDKDIRYSLKDDKGRELTTEQANYFEHSKVRDENGNLKVMYHGTQKYGFTIFDYGRQKFGLFGGGFYFTDDRTVADGYSKDSDGNAKDGSGIYEVYLNITRPIDMDAYANKERWVSAIADTFDEIPSGINKRLEELIASRSETTNGAAESIKNSDMFYIMREVMYDQELPTYDATEMAEACLRSMGYDGITHVGGGRYNFGDKNRHRVYIAFDPEQIKNVRNEKPTDHPDIRFSLKSREQLDEYIKHHGEIPKGEKPTREIHMPTKTKDNRKLSHTVRTVLEAGVTPDIAIPTIEEMAASGDFSHEVYTDKEAMADAKATIKSKGWALALSDWLDGVKKGEVSKQSTALGWTLYNNAVTSGDIETSMTILTAMVGHQRDAAQALQASRILKKLSPEGQLYQVAKSVARLQEDIDERQGKGKGKGTGGGGEARRAAEAVDDARKEAADAAEKSADGVKVKRKGNRVVIDSNQAGEPFVFEYAQKVGESLAKSLEAKRNHTEKQKTFLQQIAAELKRFASEKIPKGQKSPSLTAIDLLRDYIQNQSFYAEAWQAAQIELREKYADDEFFSEFINSGIGMDANINPQNAIFMRALVKAAADSGEGKSVLRRQSALGFTGMADTIATNLIRQTGASGEIADTIRDAAHAYVYEAISESTGDDIKLIDGAIRSAMKDIGIKIGDVVMSGTKESAQQQIVTKLVGKYGFGLAEATHTAEVVAERFGQMSKQYAENRLKSMFKERNKTQKTVEEKLEALARLGAFDVGSEYNHLAAERIFKTGTTLTVDTDLAEQFLQATTQEERDEILKEIYRDIGRQVPATFMDKWNAWRYYAMLGNIRTHVRNALGNTFFMPVVFAKDMTATAIESAVSRVTKGGIQRTKQYGSLTTKRGREILKASWADFDKVKESMGDAKYSESVNANRYIEEGRRIFKFKPLEKLRKGNSNLLESEDMLASRPHYAFAMAQYCLANNITAEQIAKGKAILPARTYAMNEAKKATYRDVNAFSQMVSGWGRSDGKNVVKKVGSAIVSGILPFRRTPANILVRGLEYSPAGLLKSLTVDLWKVKNGDKTAAEAIDNIAAGLTGTGLVGLGVLLAAEGLLRGHGGDDEDENKFDELMGHQAYALELPGGKSITLDWLAPEVLPLFIGVNLWEMTGAEHENVTLSTILGAVSNVTEPLLEMSCLQSLNDVFDSVGYATSEGLDALPAALASAATSYLTQGLPTLLGQGERSAQEDRMTTYTEKNDFLTGDMQYLLGSISAKVPVWDYNQIPYIDAWGRKETNGNTLERIGNNFLNPAYTSDVAMSDMEAELLRLYEQTGEAGVLPERAPKYFTVSGERIDLTAEQYVKYATVKGQTSYKMITDLVTSKEYKALTDAEKVKAISEVYAMANEEAKAAVSNYKPTSNKAGINPSSYAVYEAHKATAREDGKLDQSEVFDIIESMLTNGLNDDDAWALYIDEYTPTSATAASGYNKDGTMNAYGVRDAGVDIGTWLEFKENVNNLEYESGKQGARKTAFEEMLEEMGIDDETYAILFGTEYKSGGGSGGTFGGGAFGGGSMFGN